MPEPELMYLQLADNVGLEASHVHILDQDGQPLVNERHEELAPLTSIGLQIPMPVMIGDDVGMTTTRAEITTLDTLGAEGEVVDGEGRFCRARIIPDSRIVETDHPAVINVLMSTGQYVQCDPPKTEQPRKPKATEQAAQDRLANASHGPDSNTEGE